MNNVMELSVDMQTVEPGKEWLDLLADAVKHGLIGTDADTAIRAALEGGFVGIEERPSRIAACFAGGKAASMALDAISPLFAPGDVIELRAIDPAGGGAKSHSGRLDEPDQRAAMEDFVRRHIGRRNLYFGANPRIDAMAGDERAATDADVRVRSAVFLDLDYKDAPDVDSHWTRTRDALQDLGPAMTVGTGNGLHVWFLVDEADRSDGSPPAEMLASALRRVG